MHPRRRTLATIPRLGAFVLVFIFLGACSGGPIASNDTTAAADATAGADGTTTPPDGSVGPGLDVASADVPGAVDPFACPGGRNCACAQHSECLSGLCFDLGNGQGGPGKKRCIEPCEHTDCQGDRVCRRVIMGGKGGWMCVPPRVHLCNPCKTSSACEGVGLTDSVCVDYGDLGGFCGARCLGDVDCGVGYACRAVRAIDGGDAMQCIKVDKVGVMAECGCSQEAVDAGLETVCANAGDGSGGSCTGTRKCSSAGLSACNAKAPKAETCDTTDNDCDGQTDEDSCGDGNPCTDDSCDGNLGCINAPNTAGCDADGSVCTTGDHCKAGKCAAGAARLCDDGVACTTDSCDKALGCKHADSAASCDADGDACTIGDGCKGGACVAGPWKDCDDKQGCTLDVCDTKKGTCSNTLVAQLSCDDGNPCTHTDLCDAKGGCAGKKLSCDDGNPCTVGACDKVNGCIAAAVTDGASCEDGDLCTGTGTCVSGACSGAKFKVCTGSVTCTESRCDGKTGKCVVKQAKEGATCSDGKACTSADACTTNGACSGKPNACDDGNFCTKDSCDEQKGGCQYLALTGVCDDDNVCTIGESCKTVSGKTTCVAATNKVCDDKNFCTLDSCDAKVGCTTTAKADGGTCDDGDACTDKDSCVSGTCKGTPKTAAVGSLAGNAQGFKDGKGAQALFSAPSGLARDSAGVIYVADLLNHRIRKVLADGTVSTFAGSPLPGQANGAASSASFNNPADVVVDGSGTLFIADRGNHLIRKITAAGVVSTLAGSNTKGIGKLDGGYVDGKGTAAKFNAPSGLVLSGGALYVADTANHRIRKVTMAGVVTTVAGSGVAGFADGKGSAAKFNAPEGIGANGSGLLYVGDTGNNRVRSIALDGTVATLAGGGTAGFKNGKGTAAQFNAPNKLWVDGLGLLLVGDRYNHRIRSIKPDGTVSVYAGSGVQDFADGTLSTAKFDQPLAIITDGKGKAWVADTGNHRIRLIDDGPKQCLIAAKVK